MIDDEVYRELDRRWSTGDPNSPFTPNASWSFWSMKAVVGGPVAVGRGMTVMVGEPVEGLRGGVVDRADALARPELCRELVDSLRQLPTRTS